MIRRVDVFDAAKYQRIALANRDPRSNAVAFVSAVPTLVKLPMALLPEPVWFA